MSKVKSKPEATSISMGLDAIFSASDQPDIDVNQSEKLSKVDTIAITKLKKSPHQPRQHFSEKELNELAESIGQHGILQPLIARHYNDAYQLIAGERRLRAAKIAGLTEVPVVICDVNDESAMAFSLIENIQREDLNAIEESEAYDCLLNEFELSHNELARRVGKSRSYVSNLLRLKHLDPKVKQLMIMGHLTMGHGRALLALPLNEQFSAAEKIIERALSVRATERLMNDLTSNNKNDRVNILIKHAQSTHWSQELSHRLSSNVAVNVNGQGVGKIIIRVESQEKLNWLLDNIVDCSDIKEFE